MAQTASPADITAVTNILKKVYPSDEIESQLQDDALTYSQIQKTKDYHDAVGDKAVMFTKVGRNIGTSARSLNGGTLGAAGHQRTQKLEYDYTANYITIKILGTTIAKMATARQSAIRAIDLEVSGALLDLKKDLQRQIFLAGDGKIATCGTTTASTTVNLSTAVTATTTVINNNDAIQNGWLDSGEYIDIGTLAAPTTILDGTSTGVTISSLTDSDTAPAIVLSSGAISTTANTHFVFKSGNVAASSVSYEMNGLGNIVESSGTVGGLSTATEATWASPVVTASASLARSHMQSAYRQSRKFGGKPNFIVTSLNHQEDYYNLLQSQVRFPDDSSLASGQVDGPMFNKIPVSADPDCPRGVMYFLEKEKLFNFSAGDINWQNTTTGGDVLAWVQTEDSFVARAAVYGNIGTDRRRSHSKIKLLTVN